MRFLNYLNEEYAGMFKCYKNAQINVFCNPDSKEMRELYDKEYEDVRFIIDPSKKHVFMWIYTVHKDAYEFLTRKGLIKNLGYYCEEKAANAYFFGTGHLVKNKIKYDQSDVLNYVTNIQSAKWYSKNTDNSWLLNYFVSIDFLNKAAVNEEYLFTLPGGKLDNADL